MSETSYYAKNRERMLAASNAYYAANREKAIAYQSRWIKENPIKRRLKNVQSRAKARGIKFDRKACEACITDGLSYGKCALTGLPFEDTPAGRAEIDRIDASRGYVAGNMRLVRGEVNRMLSDMGLTRIYELVSLIAQIKNPAEAGS